MGHLEVGAIFAHRAIADEHLERGSVEARKGRVATECHPAQRHAAAHVDVGALWSREIKRRR
eukprot:5170052-Pleurochrysis_carterae.AAC.2